MSSSGTASEYPKPDHVVEIPARLASKLSPSELQKLEDHAKAHHDSRKLLVKVEHYMEGGMKMEDAFSKAQQELSQK